MEAFLGFLFHGFFFDPVKLLQPDSVFNLFAHLNENRLVHARTAGFMKTRKYVFYAFESDHDRADCVIGHLVAHTLKLCYRKDWPSTSIAFAVDTDQRSAY